MYQVRQALEALAAKLFALNASEKQIQELARSTETLASAYGSGDIDQILSEKDAFYSVLYAGCGNKLAPQILKVLNGRIKLLRSISLSVPGRMRRAYGRCVN